GLLVIAGVHGDPGVVQRDQEVAHGAREAGQVTAVGADRVVDVLRRRADKQAGEPLLLQLRAQPFDPLGLRHGSSLRSFCPPRPAGRSCKPPPGQGSGYFPFACLASFIVSTAASSAYW